MSALCYILKLLNLYFLKKHILMTYYYKSRGGGTTTQQGCYFGTRDPEQGIQIGNYLKQGILF